MKRPYALLLMAFVSLSAGAPGPAVARDASLAKAKYLDPKLPTEKRVADLLARMTLEEKIAQLNGYWFPKSGVLVDDQLRPALGNDKARALLANGLGEISRPSENEDRKKNLGPRQMAELTNALQKYVIEQTRLGIPLLNHEEGLHGLQAPGATSYPQPIALAASFDPALVEEVMTAVAKETRARGAQHTLAPVVDVMRDARWGRAEETYGEDPYLVTRMGVAAVRGLQGPPKADRKIDSNHVMATLKHFAVHGQPESGINVGPGNLSERVIREVFFPPFVAAIKEAGARAVMPAYVEIDGVPAHANKQFLQDILRKEWGFDGLDRVRLLRGRAAQVAAFGRRQRRGRRAAGAGVGRRSGAARPEDVPAAARAGEVEGDPDRARSTSRWRACCAPSSTSACSSSRTSTSSRRTRSRAPPNTRRWRARRPIDRSSC